jgi:DNA-binding NarL/FixJ family response regulator
MGKVRIVLADDHAVVRAGIANALRCLTDLEIVAELGDGQHILATLEQHQPDMLVTDVTMPNFEPISAITTIRERFPELKILVISAYDDDAYVQGLLGAGVNGYHLKDQPLGDLRLAVQRILEGNRWICSPLIEKLLRVNQSSPALSPQVALTERQYELLACLQQGLDNQAIARRMGLSIKTIENHLTRLYRQLHVQSRLEAVNYLSRHPELLNALSIRQSSRLQSSGAQAQQSVLIVDDNARYRTQMRRMVGRSFPQAQIFEAEQTRPALQIVDEVQPRIAFVDVVLGDENGIECVRQIKTRSPQTKIVLISAYPDREFHRLGLEAGAIAFLDKKDLDAAALREVIDDLFGDSSHNTQSSNPLY